MQFRSRGAGCSSWPRAPGRVSSSIDPADRRVTIRDPDAARFGAGLGLRTGLTDRLSVFAEGRVTLNAFDDLASTTEAGRFPLEAPTRFQAGFGFTFRGK